MLSIGRCYPCTLAIKKTKKNEERIVRNAILGITNIDILCNLLLVLTRSF